MTKFLSFTLFFAALQAWALPPYAYVTDSEELPPYGKIQVVDWQTSTVHATIPVRGEYPSAIAIHPNGSRAYLLNYNSIQVVCLLSNRVIAQIPFQPRGIIVPRALAITPDGKFVYVSNGTPGEEVVALSTATNSIVAHIDLGDPNIFNEPEGSTGTVVISPDSKLVYIVHWHPNAGNPPANAKVAVIATATNTVVADIPVGLTSQNGYAPGGDSLALTPNGEFLYVMSAASGSISVVSTAERKVVDTIPLENTIRMTITPDGKSAWVALFSSPPYYYSIAIIDIATNNVVGQINSEGFDSVQDLGITPDGLSAYTVDGSNKIKVFSTSTKQITRTIPAGYNLTSIAFGHY